MPDTVEQKPVELTLGDGTVVKGASLEEAFKTVAKMKEDTAAALRAEKEERLRLETQFHETQAELERLKAPKNDGEFNKNEYYRLLNEDPISAQNYLDVHRFGTEDPVSRFNEVSSRVDELYQQNISATFVARHPEFSQSEADAIAMTNRYRELLGRGHPYAYDTMELAYSQLLSEQKVKPTERTPEKDDTPNPSLSAGAGAQIQDAATDEIRKLENMSTEQMEAYLRSKGVLR